MGTALFVRLSVCGSIYIYRCRALLVLGCTCFFAYNLAPEQAKVETNPFLQPHLPEIHEMTEELEETDLDNMSQEELDELQNQ